MKKEILRQSIHASGIFVIFLERFFDPLVLIIICAAIIICGAIIFRIDKDHHIFLLSPIIKTCKRQQDEKGFMYFFFGVIIALSLFQINIANAIIVILVLGDSASTVFGKAFGRTPLPLNKKKTIEGSLAFFVVGFAAALTQLPFLPSLIGALFGTFAEGYSPIDDNISIPLVSGIVMSVVVHCI